MSVSGTRAGWGRPSPTVQFRSCCSTRFEPSRLTGGVRFVARPHGERTSFVTAHSPPPIGRSNCFRCCVSHVIFDISPLATLQTWRFDFIGKSRVINLVLHRSDEHRADRISRSELCLTQLHTAHSKERDILLAIYTQCWAQTFHSRRKPLESFLVSERQRTER